MMETDQHGQTTAVNAGEESPGRPPGRPMRQLEFHQAMSDFCHMFPGTDEEVIEAVLRANNGMVDATIDQLLTMNIDSEVRLDDDLPDHVLMSVERDVQQQQQQHLHLGSRRSNREARTNRKVMSSDPSQPQSKESEDCPPSYTEAVQSHLSHHHRSGNSRNRHRHSPTSSSSVAHNARHSVGTMQHLLDLGPDTAPSSGGSITALPGVPGALSKAHHGYNSSHNHHHSHHHQKFSSQRHRPEVSEGSPSKSRPGRNILAPTTLPAYGHHDRTTPAEFNFRSQRNGSLDSNDVEGSVCPQREDSPHGCQREATNVKRPVYRNWNPPLLGTLPDDFLRITKTPAVPTRPSRPGTQLLRTMSAVGPDRPQVSPHMTAVEAGPTPTLVQPTKSKSSHKPHRSLSFAGHTNQAKKTTLLNSTGLTQHEFSSNILQEKMKENERRRRLASIDMDSDLAQYLEDERVAIILQNSEFLQELRDDRMFMMTLEKDQTSDDEKTQPPPQVDPVVPFILEGEDRNFIEGYGDDRRDTLEAFPFSQQLPPVASEDVELRQKLKNMGKASRKQFAALARKFFLKRRKKSAQQILKESQAPSMMNLLDERDDEDEDEEPMLSESLTQSTLDTQKISPTPVWNSPKLRRGHFDIV